MRKWLVGPVLSAGLIGATLGVAFAVTTTQAERKAETLRNLDLYAQILAKVQEDYVVDVDENAAIEASIEGMLSYLDPHSTYLNAQELQDMRASTEGEYGGLGIEVSGEDGFVKVIAPMEDTPASRAGIKSGDFLVAIDGVSIVGLPLSEAVQKMRGEVGEEIRVTIAREGQDPFDASMKREKIRPASVRHRIEGGDVGYVRISAFNELTTSSLDKSLAAVQREAKGPLKGLVIDLRDNPGGLLDQAINVSSRFMDGGEIVSARGRKPNDTKRYGAVKGKRFPNVPIVVLTNSGSASAAEIVAGAIQDRGRGKVLGLTTFGKGSIQTVQPLGTGKGALRLTTARYYTPSGKSIQGVGIKPDFEVAAVRLTDEAIKDLEKRAARFSEASLPHALENDQGAEREKPHVPKDMPPADYKGEDYQLDRAVQLLKSGQITIGADPTARKTTTASRAR
jgi:carboxyl-terminal processing protease